MLQSILLRRITLYLIPTKTEIFISLPIMLPYLKLPFEFSIIHGILFCKSILNYFSFASPVFDPAVNMFFVFYFQHFFCLLTNNLSFYLFIRCKV